MVAELALRFHAESLDWPTTKSRADTLDYLCIRATHAPVRRVMLRSSWSPDSGELWIDVGDSDWTVIADSSTDWLRVQSPPMLFRRVPTMGSLASSPEPVDRTEPLAFLKSLVPVQVADVRLLLALLSVT